MMKGILLVVMVFFGSCDAPKIDEELENADYTAAKYMVNAQLSGLKYNIDELEHHYAKISHDSSKAYRILFSKSLKYLVRDGQPPTVKNIDRVIYSPRVELIVLESENR